MENPNDPTHTQDLRISAYDEVLFRYGELSKFAEKAIDKANIGGSLSVNVHVDDLEAEQDQDNSYELLLLLLGAKAYELILEEARSAKWFTDLLGVSYFRGMTMAERELEKLMFPNPASHANRS